MSSTTFASPLSRRFLLRSAAVSFIAFGTRGAFAEQLAATPAQTEGPFYPDKLPLDTDNDLIVVNDSVTSAVGQITHLTGRVLDSKGSPVRNAVVEIWQCDARGVYMHSRDRDQTKRDSHFQSFGRFTTASTGDYYFRTIKPVAYPGRTPHIHFKIKHASKELLTTQLYVKGHELNDRDGIWRSTPAGGPRESITVDFSPIPDSKLNELAAKFDIILGVTPEA